MTRIGETAREMRTPGDAFGITWRVEARSPGASPAWNLAGPSLMRRAALLFIPVALCLVSPARVAAPAKAPAREAVEFFEKHVRPVLLDKCQSCHGPSK